MLRSDGQQEDIKTHRSMQIADSAMAGQSILTVDFAATRILQAALATCIGDADG